MGNSHPGGKMQLIECALCDRDRSEKFRQEQGDEAMRTSEARTKLGVHVASNKITRLGIDIPTQRSTIRFAEAWRDRVRGSSFEIPFPSISLIQLLANQPAIRRSSDVEQWKHIPRKAASGTQAFR